MANGKTHYVVVVIQSKLNEAKRESLTVSSVNRNPSRMSASVLQCPSLPLPTTMRSCQLAKSGKLGSKLLKQSQNRRIIIQREWGHSDDKREITVADSISLVRVRPNGLL